ncbi:MAG: PP2C family serine/threonine-protein phosphatase [Mariprofundales bacterium]
MNFYIKTILYYLQNTEEYDPKSRYTIKMAKALSKDTTIQHLINRLRIEICNKVEDQDQGLKVMSRSYLKNNKTTKNISKKENTNHNVQLPILHVLFNIPNLTVGKPFEEKIITLDKLDGELKIYSTSADNELDGLSINHSTFMIAGTIKESGNCEIELLCQLLLPSGATQRVKGKLKISVIPDPRLLWKNLPSDNTARFHKPDIASDSAMTESVNLIAASVRGRSHAHKGTHRDDDIKIYCSSTSDWNIICVADGAGSCKYSRRGSELAVLHSTDTLRETLNGYYGIELEKITQSLHNNDEEIKSQLGEIYQHTIVKAVYNAALAIQEEVKNNKEASFKDFSTTLLLAAHKPIKDGHLILSFWIGDGGAVIYDKGNNVKLLGKPDSGEYAGQTQFLDNKLFDDGSIYSRIRIQKVDSMTALILATDGITDAKFETENKLSNLEAWDVLWDELQVIANNKDLKQAEKDLLEWMEFWSAGNHDDRSIAICYVKE